MDSDFKVSVLTKFSSFETLEFSKNLDAPILDVIAKIKFFEPSPDLRKYLILEKISKDCHSSQSEIAKHSKIVPAMVNRYISEFRKTKKIKVSGKNHKRAKYFLSAEGENLRKKYLFEFINEILVLYKEIKKIIKYKIEKISGLYKNKKIVFYGANEITELIFQIENDLNIVGVIDSDKKIIAKRTSWNVECYLPEKLKKLKFDLIIITSLTHRFEIYNQIKHLESDKKKILIFADI